MRVLLDTHVLIWWFTERHQLSGRVVDIFAAERTQIFVSSASLWEVATKARIGKLPKMATYVPGLIALIDDAAFLPLSVSPDHGLRAGGYLVSHGDPFDRMLAAQAELEGLTLLTTDPAFNAFPCATLW